MMFGDFQKDDLLCEKGWIARFQHFLWK